MAKDNELREKLRLIKERFGVAVPKWRTVDAGTARERGLRSYSKEEKFEQDMLVDWIANDEEFWQLMQVYFGYCDILTSRGYGSKDDAHMVRDLETQTKVARNFAKGEVQYVYHDMCCDPDTILGNGNGDGYWIYLDRPYQDVSHMRVGEAILNLDEVWAVVDGVLDEWAQKGLEREQHFRDHKAYKCDRCGKPIYDRPGSRFDMYENLLHCKACAHECNHWKRRTR